MAKIKRYWKTFFLSLAIFTVIGWLVVTGLIADPLPGQETPAEQSAVTPEATSIELATFCAVKALRGKFCLNNIDIAVMGCSEEQAGEVLGTLLAWYKANQANILAAEKTEFIAKKNLRSAIRKMNMGPKNEELIANVPQLQENLASASQQSNTLLEGAVTAVESKLTSDQKTIWSTIRSNKSAPAKYRYAAGLTPEQIIQLRKEISNKVRRQASAKNSKEISRADSVFKQAEGNILGNTQTTSMDTAASAASLRMADVLKADQAVLPLPEELKTSAISSESAEKVLESLQAR